MSWLQWLCYEGLLVLLDPRLEDGAPLLEPWNKDDMRGAYVDLPLRGGTLRVFGLKWQGASTTRVLEGTQRAFNEATDPTAIDYRLLMMHTGVDGQVPRMSGLPTLGQYEPLRPHIDYLALGHVHKPYELNGWIFNPGSTETVSVDETTWESRGFYLVEVNTDVAPGEPLHHATRIQGKRRPFLRHSLSVDGLNEPNEIYALLEEYCRREGSLHASSDERNRPLVHIDIYGTLAFDNSALDQDYMEELVQTHFNPLHIRIANHTNDRDYQPETGEIDGRNRASWHELERKVFQDLVSRDVRYQPKLEEWGQTLGHLKEMALEKQEPEAIAAYLRNQRETLLATN
jgi:DNA repair exonuclease SbcCD nuclease subunit